jgi:hypothetical protein
LGFDDCQVAVEVMSCDAVADDLSKAVSCRLSPTRKVSPPVKEIEGWNVADGAGAVVVVEVVLVVDVVVDGVVAELVQALAQRTAAANGSRERSILACRARTLPLTLPLRLNELQRSASTIFTCRPLVLTGVHSAAVTLDAMILGR